MHGDGHVPIDRDCYAVVASCPPLTVTLFGDFRRAAEALNRIDETGCGSPCWKAHRIVDLADDGDTEADE